MYQKVIVAGHVGSDPEMRYLPNADCVTNFSVAVNRRVKQGDETVSQTIWFRCSAWGKLAEVVNQYLEKGAKVLVEGQLNFDPATGGPNQFPRRDGTVGTAFELKVDGVTFLSSKAERENSSGRKPTEGDDDNIPF